jgi:histidine triad (HIT) family protein
MCLFCKIANKEIPATIVYETETVLAFKDIAPQAPVHIVIIPKKHVAASLADLKDFRVVADLAQAAQQIAREQQLANGFRLVTNSGADAGQTVAHLHYHLLGGRVLGWPPG